VSPRFSDELYAALLDLDEASREAVAARLTKLVRSAPLHETLTIVLGPVGLHRLYLGDWLGGLARLGLAALVPALAFVGFWRGESGPFVMAGGLAAAVVGLWLWDYFRREVALNRYHGLLERRALAALAGDPSRL
jgi:hypothetical protein